MPQSLFCLFVFGLVDASTDETDMDLRDYHGIS